MSSPLSSSRAIATTGQLWRESTETRHAGKRELAVAMRDARHRSLAIVNAYSQALGPRMEVAYSTQLNPPLWELGHVGWFHDYWLSRNPQRSLGDNADPDVARLTPERGNADALYDSSHVAHPSRWALPLPDLEQTISDLAQQMQRNLDLLESAGEKDADLYFFRLTLLHEDMHAEAALYMADALGVVLPESLFRARVTSPGGEACKFDAGPWTLGTPKPGFCFDNEWGEHEVQVDAFEIDAAPVDWARFLPFIEDGGYRERRYWSKEAWHWLEQQHPSPAERLPRYLRFHAGRWERQHMGQWRDLEVDEAATHLTAHEAQAWCRWAGRRLPSEAEWERAAMTAPRSRFVWGDLWEWTSSLFQPYPGFRAHPYRDYSQPWFGSRPVLRGASRATHARMVHPKYRNFFTSERNDIHAGFRSCRQS